MAATVEKAIENILNSDEISSTICLSDQDAKIAELAFYKAESRGFEAGYEFDDWIAAEQEFLF